MQEYKDSSQISEKQILLGQVARIVDIATILIKESESKLQSEETIPMRCLMFGLYGILTHPQMTINLPFKAQRIELPQGISESDAFMVASGIGFYNPKMATEILQRCSIPEPQSDSIISIPNAEKYRDNKIFGTVFTHLKPGEPKASQLFDARQKEKPANPSPIATLIQLIHIQQKIGEYNDAKQTETLLKN